MKQIRFQGNNLYSICPIEDNERDRSYFLSLVRSLFDLGGFLAVESSRPIFENSALLQRLLSLETELVGFWHNSISVGYEYATSTHNSEVLSLVLDIWFSYEQNKFSFFFDEEKYRSGSKDSGLSIVELNKDMPLNIIYGGGLQDIIWFRKNESLSLEDVIHTLP